MLGLAATTLAVAGSLAGGHHAQPAQHDPAPAGATTNRLSWSGYTWRLKDGRGNLGQCWSPSRVSVVGDVLRIQNGNGCGGGIGMISNRGKTYGTWTIRYRMDAGAGVKYAALLWPDSGSRPEIDFAEGSKHDPLRQVVNATYHPLPGCTACTQFHTAVDLTTWHTLSVRWTSAGFAFILDGRQWAYKAVHTAKPEHLSIQTWQFAPGPATVLEVADVAVS